MFSPPVKCSELNEALCCVYHSPQEIKPGTNSALQEARCDLQSVRFYKNDGATDRMIHNFVVIDIFLCAACKLSYLSSMELNQMVLSSWNNLHTANATTRFPELCSRRGLLNAPSWQAALLPPVTDPTSHFSCWEQLREQLDSGIGPFNNLQSGVWCRSCDNRNMSQHHVKAFVRQSLPFPAATWAGPPSSSQGLIRKGDPKLLDIWWHDPQHQPDFGPWLFMDSSQIRGGVWMDKEVIVVQCRPEQYQRWLTGLVLAVSVWANDINTERSRHDFCCVKQFTGTLLRKCLVKFRH